MNHDPDHDKMDVLIMNGCLLAIVSAIIVLAGIGVLFLRFKYFA